MYFPIELQTKKNEHGVIFIQSFSFYRVSNFRCRLDILWFYFSWRYSIQICIVFIVWFLDEIELATINHFLLDGYDAFFSPFVLCGYFHYILISTCSKLVISSFAAVVQLFFFSSSFFFFTLFDHYLIITCISTLENRLEYLNIRIQQMKTKQTRKHCLASSVESNYFFPFIHSHYMPINLICVSYWHSIRKAAVWAKLT